MNASICKISVVVFGWMLVVSTGYGMIDSNGDGVSDLWQQMHPGLAPGEDADGDGYSNKTEALAGTDPGSAAAHPRVSGIGLVENGQAVELSWQGVAGKRYTVERWNVESGVWGTAGEKTCAADGLDHLRVPSAGAVGLYRVRIGDVDADGDGVEAWEEGLLGMSDASASTGGETDFSRAYRMMEGSGTLQLSSGVTVPKRLPGRDEVVRFLAQASFGADPDLIDHVAVVGISGWMDEQLNPASPTKSYDMMFGNGPLNASTFPWFWSRGWWRAAMTAPDQLRLRMGNALSQILVVSCAGNDRLRQNSYVQADYYDILLSHSLGNYRNLLEDVTWSTQMGLYLSHLQNRKSDIPVGRYPDENFAREIMQLFSIGLWELNPDGSRKVDAQGRDIPTYDNGTITELAKVFTGFGFGGPSATSFFATVDGNDYIHPMKMWDAEHEPGEKHLVGGVTIPAGQTGTEDVADALDALCAHPNVGPFIARLLIQRFTCSDPSPGYIRRVSDTWADNGSGTRGDLKAVLRAILMDPEARNPGARGDVSGKVREPYLRLVALMRAFKARNSNTPATFPVATSHFPDVMGQQPLWSPTVFNFYLPDHRPAGELKVRGIAAPELEIATTDRLINTDNLLQRVIDRGMDPFYMSAADVVTCDFAHARTLSGNAADLVDYLDGLLTWGALSASTRQAAITAVQAQTTAELKVETAVHLIVESPDYVVLK